MNGLLLLSLIATITMCAVCYLGGKLIRVLEDTQSHKPKLPSYILIAILVGILFNWFLDLAYIAGFTAPSYRYIIGVIGTIFFIGPIFNWPTKLSQAFERAENRIRWYRDIKRVPGIHARLDLIRTLQSERKKLDKTLRKTWKVDERQEVIEAQHALDERVDEYYREIDQLRSDYHQQKEAAVEHARQQSIDQDIKRAQALAAQDAASVDLPRVSEVREQESDPSLPLIVSSRD